MSERTAGADDTTKANTKALEENTRAINKDLSSTSSEDALLDAVRELTRVVKALQMTMREYPNRQELKLNYATRREISRRRWQIALGMIGAIIASYFFTVGSVSYCFLNGIPEPGDRDFCRAFPGYEESFDNNRKNIEIFVDMQKQIARNRIEIDELKANQK